MTAYCDSEIANCGDSRHSLHRLVVRWGRLQMRRTATVLRMWSEWNRKAHNDRTERPALPTL